MKISIITVVLNNAAYIEACIQSVINQDYENIEYIVIDGGSTDGTIDIIKKYEEKINIWISEPDNGIYDAMNKGIKLASGDIIGCLNADDAYFADNVLKNVASAMHNQCVDACHSDLIYVDREDLSKIVRYWHSCQFKPGLFKKGWVPAHPTFFVRKSIYDRYGCYDLYYKLAADYELMARFLEYHRIRAIYIPEIFVKMRVGGASNKSLRNIVRQNREIFHACKNNNITISLLSFFVSKLASRLGQFYLKPDV